MEELDFLLQQYPLWTNAEGREAEIVISSRVRLIRNLQQFKFPDRGGVEEREKVFVSLMPYLKGKKFSLSQLLALDKELLVERRIADRKFLETEQDNIGFCIEDEEDIVYTINKEDHLRFSCTLSGLNLQLAYRTADEVDDEISRNFQYAFSPHFGYLTACPINVGTGLMASVFLHLPGLVHSGKLTQIRDKIVRLGLIIKGVYGDATRVEGNIFQVSTQITLGKKEEEIVGELEKITNEFIEYEKSARDLLIKDARLQLEDKIWRAYAILKNARLLYFEEFVNLASAIRLGVGIGIFKSVSLKTLNELLVFAHSAHLQKLTGRPMEAEEIAVRRAVYVAQHLK